MFNRLLYPWNLPPYGLPNTASFDWQPKQLAAEGICVPDDVRRQIESIHWDWMFDFSCALARQLRRVGARLPSPASAPGVVLVAGEHQSLPLAASVHAFVTPLAQRAAMEIASLAEPADETDAPSQWHEISGIAFFAETASHRGSGRRLAETLQEVLTHAAWLCAGAGTGFMAPRISFARCKPATARSPVGGQEVIPVAGYKVKLAGCEPQAVMQALGDSIHELPPARRRGKRADVLVLSSLWSPMKAASPAEAG